MKGLFQRKGMSFVPAGEEGTEAVLSVPDGDLVCVEAKTFKKQHNIRQFKLYWALCGILANNYPSEEDIDKRQASDNLLLACGRVTAWVDFEGRQWFKPQSIAWENMPQEEFNAFFQLAVSKICKWLHAAPEEVRQQVFDMIDPIKGATIPNKPEPQRELVDLDTGEITMAPVPPPPPPPAPSAPPIKWKALADGLCQCRTKAEFQDRAQRFWAWHGGYPPADPAIAAKAATIHGIAAKFIKGEIDAVAKGREMEQALAR